MSTQPTDKVSIKFGSPWTILLTALFFIAKVTGHFDVSWWIVFLPLYFGVALLLGFGLLVLLAGGAVAGVVTLMEKYDRRKRRKAREKRLAETGSKTPSIRNSLR